MSTLAGLTSEVIAQIVLTWVAFFSGIGGVFAASRGGRVADGLALGLLGPCGWIAIWYLTPGRVGAELEASPLQDDWEAL